VGSTGSTTISFILPGLFYWKVGGVYVKAVLTAEPQPADGKFLQLTRDDPSVKRLNIAAFALMVYGLLIFGFW
jgi:hypothetical protein